MNLTKGFGAQNVERLFGTWGQLVEDIDFSVEKRRINLTKDFAVRNVSGP